MNVYLLTEAKKYAIQDCLIGVYASREDAEIGLKEITSYRHGWLSTNPDDYYIEEYEVETYEKLEHHWCTETIGGNNYGTETD